MTRAFVFPGQGAQTIGMVKTLAEAYPAAKAVFDEVDEALGEKLSALVWEGDQETLTLTENAQPALMATSLAAMRALEAGMSIACVEVEPSDLSQSGIDTPEDLARIKAELAALGRL